MFSALVATTHHCEAQSNHIYDRPVPSHRRKLELCSWDSQSQLKHPFLLGIEKCFGVPIHEVSDVPEQAVAHYPPKQGRVLRDSRS